MEIPREQLFVKEWDPWQKEFIDHKGSITLRAGRQVGKSAACGRRKANHMIEYPGSVSLMIAPAQRQSSELFQKTMFWLNIDHQKALEAAGGFKQDPEVSQRRNLELLRLFEKEHGIFNEMPTKTTVILKMDFKKPQSKFNVGSTCYSLPAGKTGTYLRCYALDFLDIDEAAFVPDMVHDSLDPMLWVSSKKRGLGWKTLTSTPFGKGGFFYESHQDDEFKQFHRSSEDCDRIPREKLRKWKKQKSAMLYAQDVLGEFVDEFQQYFPTKLIKSCTTFMRWNYKEHYNPGLRYYYAHDYAGPGRDDNASVVAEMQSGKPLRIIEPETDDEPNTTIINRKIVKKDEAFKFRKFLVDSGGFGCGPTDELKNLVGKRRVVGLDNSKKTIDKDGRQGKILKEDLYSNARSMMERREVDIIDNLALVSSLKSMTFEYTEGKNIKITGKNSHPAEAFVRACWCVKVKGLRLFFG